MDEKLLFTFMNFMSGHALTKPTYQSIAIKAVNQGILWENGEMGRYKQYSPLPMKKTIKTIFWNPFFKDFTIDSRPKFLRKIDYFAGLTCLVGHIPELFPEIYE